MGYETCGYVGPDAIAPGALKGGAITGISVGAMAALAIAAKTTVLLVLHKRRQLQDWKKETTCSPIHMPREPARQTLITTSTMLPS